MGGSRLYVGNLSLNVDEPHLREKFSSYGQISNIEVKNKSNIEGEAVSRFAFINLEATSGQLYQCVAELNGSVWKGSAIKVERAQENFLEKLKRERESNQKEKEDGFGSSYGDTQNNKRNYENYEHDNFDNTNEKRWKGFNFAEEQSKTDFSGKFKRENEFNQWEKTEDKFDNRFGGNKKNNYEEYDQSEDFKWDKEFNHENNSSNFYDEENTKSWNEERNNQLNILTEVLDRRTSSDVKKNEYSIRRYDPTLEDVQGPKRAKSKKVLSDARKKACRNNFAEEGNVKKTVEISSDLKFNEPSSGFSLLSMFSKQIENDEEVKTENTISKGTKSSEKVNKTRKIPPKTRNFFIEADDPILEEGAMWLITPLNAENEAEFAEVKPDLLALYKLRNKHALQQESRLKKNINRSRRGRPRKY